MNLITVLVTLLLAVAPALSGPLTTQSSKETQMSYSGSSVNKRDLYFGVGVAVPSQDHAGTHSTLMQRFKVQSHLNLLHDSHIESLLHHNKFGRRPTHEK